MWHLLLLSVFSSVALSSVQDLPSKELTSAKESAGPLSYATAYYAFSGDFTSPGYCGGNKSHICAPWSYCNQDRTCACPSVVFKCDPQGYIAGIVSCYCATYTEEENLIEVGRCPYYCMRQKSLEGHQVYRSFPKNRSEWNNATCAGYNRHGTLCSRCSEGFYPLASSFAIYCAKCQSSGWWKHVLSVILPLTAFYWIILLFKITVHNSRWLGYIFSCQILTAPMYARMVVNHKHYKGISYVYLMYGIWNLDFLHFNKAGFCLQINTLETLALDLAVGVYPLCLIAITYALIRFYDSKLVVLMKPYYRFFNHFPAQWNIRNSIVGTFATFLLLSNVKFLNACTDLLIPVNVDQFVTLHEINSTWRLYYDASIPYFGTAHLPYAILALAVLFFFVISPTLLLLLYPFIFCQRCLNLLPRRAQIFLHIFTDSFQGCYKDGTEPGTRDCRWFSAVPFLAHILFFLVGGSTLTSVILPYTAIVITLLTLSAIHANPFKDRLSSLLSHFIAYMTFLAGAVASFMGLEMSIIREYHTAQPIFGLLVIVFLVLPLLVISLTFYWTVFHGRFVRFIGRIKAWRHGYTEELMQ